ncbi:hypothetical protein DY000_02002386 [Brassica cretica]|uniref:Uncharacterized protein n=1 Tax=Brassica cretica TaxID=69181 RepID=A0ABQ7BUC2_BRACR|nr:hypothetical protein DY000_02002386 [Brassica cretica]
MSIPMRSPPQRTFLASQNRSKQTSTVEEERPVCKSKRKKMKDRIQNSNLH